MLNLDDLAEEDRAYFVAQRGRLERVAEDLTGLQVERRRERTALVARARQLTDRPFPAQGAVKQLALLLVAALCERGRGDGTTSSEAEVAGMGRDLLTRHAVHWPWEPQDGEAVARAVREALGVLTDLRLVPVGEHGSASCPPRIAGERPSRGDRLSWSSHEALPSAPHGYRWPLRVRQVFTAEDGRLALSGRNTSGKSKALELLIPFVSTATSRPASSTPSRRGPRRCAGT